MAKIRVFFCDEFKTYLASSKETIHRLVYIGIVNYEQGEIRKYPLLIWENVQVTKTKKP